jgi:hypothetical protein
VLARRRHECGELLHELGGLEHEVRRAVGASVARVTGSLAKLEIRVPAWAVPKPSPKKSSSDAEAPNWRMAFAYSDSDDSKGGQQKLVAAIPFTWGDASTFRGVVELPDGERYPPASFVEEKSP